MSEARKYRGRTPGLAMRQAREELGDDARLVNARRVSGPGLPPIYEVQVTPAKEEMAPGVASLQRELTALREAIQDLRQDPTATPIPAAQPVVAKAPVAPVASPPQSLEDTPAPSDLEFAFELAPEPTAIADAFGPWREALIRCGAGEELTQDLLEAAADSGAPKDLAAAGELVRAELTHCLGTGQESILPARFTIVGGPAGVGKTATLAKLAAEHVAAGRRPILVCTDGESLTGEEELQAVATALGLPFETTFLPGELEDLQTRYPQGEVLVDTAARTPWDRDGLTRVKEIKSALPDSELLLVMSADTDLDEAHDLARAWRDIDAERIVVTKLDALSRPGRLLRLARRLPLPLARVSFGPSARGASAFPGDARVIARLLATDLAVELTA